MPSNVDTLLFNLLDSFLWSDKFHDELWRAWDEIIEVEISAVVVGSLLEFTVLLLASQESADWHWHWHWHWPSHVTCPEPSCSESHAKLLPLQRCTAREYEAAGPGSHKARSIMRIKCKFICFEKMLNINVIQKILMFVKILIPCGLHCGGRRSI